MSKRRILITSALPYINGIKHLGNLAGSMPEANITIETEQMSAYDAADLIVKSVNLS